MNYQEELEKIYNESFPSLPDTQSIADDATSIVNDMESITLPEETILLSETKNVLETVELPNGEQRTILNGKYTVKDEDDKYFYCTQVREYEMKIMKDEYKATMKYRNAQGQILKGYSLIKMTEGETVRKPRKKQFNAKTASKFVKEDLLAYIVDMLENGDMPDSAKIKSALTLLNFEKPTLSASTQETVIRIKNDEFDEPEENEE